MEDTAQKSGSQRGCPRRGLPGGVPPERANRGSGWSPPPMGFYIGILIKSSPPKGGVHKLMILLRDLPKDFFRKFFGEEMGGVRGTQTP